jgi:integrase
MASANFYLKDTKTTNKTPIYLIFNYHNQRLKFSTGEQIVPKQWNSQSQRVKRNFTGASELNHYLDKVEADILRIYRVAQIDGVGITNSFLKDALNAVLNKNPVVIVDFFETLEQYIEIKGSKLSHNYMRRVNTLKNHLLTFQKKRKFPVTFSNIDLRFYDLFTDYLLKDLRQLNNTIGGNIAVLKTFLDWATSRGINKNVGYKDREFKAIKQDGDIIYLTHEELMQLYELDLSEIPRLENVRDAFCFGCFTGLRFSDISRIRRDHIKGDFLQILTQKTRDRLQIPLNDFAKEILDRNKYKLTVISNQKTNSYLKELGELAELYEPQLITKFRGKERIETTEPKYMHLSTHTARRTFVTLSLEKGMRAEIVMEITGHKNYKTFKRYVMLTDDVKSAAMKQIWSKDSSSKLVAV